MTTPRDNWIRIANTAKDIKLPTQLDAAPHRLTIRTRIWGSGTIGEGSPTDSDLILPQKFKVRSVTNREVSGSGGRYELGDVRVSGITQRPSDENVTGYTVEQLAPVSGAPNVEVIYILSGPMAGEYTRVELNYYKLLSASLIIRKRSGVEFLDNYIRVTGDSRVTVI